MRPVDIEGEVITILAGLADSVATRIPNPRPDTNIRVTRTGGSRTNIIQSTPTVLIECWAADEMAALGIACDASDRLEAAYGIGTWGGRLVLTEPVNFPDPDTPSPRYQLIAQITTDL